MMVRMALTILALMSSLAMTVRIFENLTKKPSRKIWADLNLMVMLVSPKKMKKGRNILGLNGIMHMEYQSLVERNSLMTQ